MTDLLVNNSPGAVAQESTSAGAAGSRQAGLRALRALANALLAIVVIVVTWQLIVKNAHLDPFTTKGPGDVWKYLRAPENDLARHELLSATKITVRDAALGLFSGTIAGVALALVFNRYRVVEQAVLPIAMAFRAVPLVALTPLIVLIFHRGLAAVTMIAGIITFFPTLINVGLALRAVPDPSIDLMRAYGATKGTTLRKVQLPSALPALFASVRIAAPLALVGALLAEWLATGKGLGSVMLLSAPQSDYEKLWSSAAITTFMGVILYGIVASVEQVILGRFSDDPNAGR
ncbi:MAG: binding-protein-dependent transport system inner rane component [Acidimicrobiales bacterium]|nr:binding-protein-dependent transport system inner rane component [Acidimicrobiales bacterium]